MGVYPHSRPPHTVFQLFSIKKKFIGYHLYWTLGKSKFEPLLDYVHLSVLFVAEVQVVRCCAVSTTSPTYISFKSVIEGGNH